MVEPLSNLLNTIHVKYDKSLTRSTDNSLTLAQATAIFTENLIGSFEIKNLRYIYHSIKIEFDKKVKELLILPDYITINCNNDISSSRNIVVESAIRKRYPLFTTESYKTISRPPQFYFIDLTSSNESTILQSTSSIPVKEYSKSTDTKSDTYGISFFNKSSFKSLPIKSRLLTQTQPKLTPSRRSVQLTTNVPNIITQSYYSKYFENNSNDFKDYELNVFQLDSNLVDKIIENDKQQGRLPTALFLQEAYIDGGKFCSDSLDIASKIALKHNIWIHFEGLLKNFNVDSFSLPLDRLGYNTSISITGTRDLQLISTIAPNKQVELSNSSRIQLQSELRILIMSWLLLFEYNVPFPNLISEGYLLCNYVKEKLLNFNSHISYVIGKSRTDAFPVISFYPILSEELLTNSFCTKDEILLNFSKKLKLPKSITVGNFNILPYQENETSSFSELSIDSTKFSKVMFLFQPLNDLCNLNQQCFIKDNFFLISITKFIDLFNREINLALRNVTILRKQFNLLLSQVSNLNLSFEIINLNEIDEVSKSCAISAFRCIPTLLKSPSKSEIIKFEPLLNIFNLNFISNILKQYIFIEKAVTLDGKFCCKINSPTFELNYSHSHHLDSLLEEEVNFIFDSVKLFETVAQAVELPEEINAAISNSIQKGIKDAEIRLLQEKNDLIAKNFSTSNVIYNVATYIPGVGPVVNWWNTPFSKTENNIADVEIYTSHNNQSVPEVFPSTPLNSNTKSSYSPQPNPRRMSSIATIGHQFDIRLGLDNEIALNN